MLKKIILGLTIVAFAGIGGAVAQAPAPGGIKRTPLQKIEFPKGYNIVTVIAEIPADTLAGRHTHPGVDTGYVLEGEAMLAHDGTDTVGPPAGWLEIGFDLHSVNVGVDKNAAR